MPSALVANKLPSAVEVKGLSRSKSVNDMCRVSYMKNKEEKEYEEDHEKVSTRPHLCPHGPQSDGLW